MKKNAIIILIISLIVIASCIMLIRTNSKVSKVVLQQNKEYEQYLENEIYGTDVITLINKAISNNEQNKVPKDEDGNFINNNTNSINIELVMITDEEKNKTTTYKMEAINKVGITEFIKNFNTEKFKCTNKTYHSDTGKICYIELTQQPSY